MQKFKVGDSIIISSYCNTISSFGGDELACTNLINKTFKITDIRLEPTISGKNRVNGAYLKGDPINYLWDCHDFNKTIEIL